ERPRDGSLLERLFRRIDDGDEIQIAADAPVAARVRPEVPDPLHVRSIARNSLGPYPRGAIDLRSVRPDEHGRIQGSHRHIESPDRSAVPRSVRTGRLPDGHLRNAWPRK